MSALEAIVAATRQALQHRRARLPLAALARQQTADPARGRRFEAALRADGLSLIAEHKRRSPSAGVIREDLELAQVIGAYERAGAAALSVLTEEQSFGGSLEDLRSARALSALPILRKDFTVDAYQLYEALVAGADAVLLIVAALTDAELERLHALARELGMAALVEIHDERELERALAIGPRIVGVNNRDLRTLQVDTARAPALRERIPAGIVCVAESGYSRPEQLVALREAGFDAVLMGEALMRCADIESACRELVDAGLPSEAACRGNVQARR